jgi:surface antigen
METGPQGLLERSAAGVVRRTAVLLAVLTTSLAGLGLGSAAAARADESAGSELCSGYAACSTDGFTTNGYPARANTSWWRMYPGVNCTNYAAYVESQIFGVSDPTYLLGDAYQWAANASANGVPVDDNPTVGAVAFWGSNTPGMDHYGHVAIVQAVGPNGSYIDISQSGMGATDNGYDWERIYAGSSSWQPWPDSFIHFPGAAIPAPTPVPFTQMMLAHVRWGSDISSGSEAALQPGTIG